MGDAIRRAVGRLFQLAAVGMLLTAAWLMWNSRPSVRADREVTGTITKVYAVSTRLENNTYRTERCTAYTYVHPTAGRDEREFCGNDYGEEGSDIRLAVMPYAAFFTGPANWNRIFWLGGAGFGTFSFVFGLMGFGMLKPPE